MKREIRNESDDKDNTSGHIKLNEDDLNCDCHRCIARRKDNTNKTDSSNDQKNYRED